MKSILTLLVMDLIWIMSVMRLRYGEQVQKIQGDTMQVNMLAALLAYFFMIWGLVQFVIPNVRKDHAFRDAVVHGGSFGVIVYGVYNFTCMSVFRHWPWSTVLLDVTWGFTVYTLSAWVSSSE